MITRETSKQLVRKIHGPVGRRFSTPGKHDDIVYRAAAPVPVAVNTTLEKRALQHQKMMSTRIFKPLVITGPTCSGKTTLIHHLKYTHPEFTHILPYTTRLVFPKYQVEGTDYKSVAAAFFEDRAGGADDSTLGKRWLFLESEQIAETPYMRAVA